MPEPFNPYRPPEADAVPPPPEQQIPVADWRPFEAYEDGDALVISREAPLPDVCLKCGAAHSPMRRRPASFTWIPPTAFFLLCCGWLGILIMMLSFAKQARFHLPICEECNLRWRNGTLGIVVGLVTIIVGFYLLFFLGSALGDEGAAVLGVALGAIFLGAPLLLVAYRVFVRPRTVWCSRIEPELLWLAGVDAKARTAAIALLQTYGRKQTYGRAPRQAQRRPLGP